MAQGITDTRPFMDDQTEQEYQNKAVRFRFLNQLLLGVGGATVFGVVAAVGVALLNSVVANGIAASVLPLLGIGGLAVIGISCIYAGSQYLTKNIMLDQSYQAKKIAIATGRGRNDIEIVTEPVHSPISPTGMGAATQPDQEDPAIEAILATERTSSQWANKFAAASRPMAPSLDRAHASTWSERAAAKDEAAAPTQALHA